MCHCADSAYQKLTSTFDLLTVGPKFTRPTCRAAAAAIDRYLLPAPDLSSKPADRRCCYRSTGQTDGRNDTRLFYDAYRILRGRVIVRLFLTNLFKKISTFFHIQL